MADQDTPSDGETDSEESLEAFEELVDSNQDAFRALTDFLQSGSRAPAGLEHPGARVGPWVLARLVGRGGMGTTWLASDPEGRRVALKLINRPNAHQQARFEAECHSLSRLDHPHVVSYLDHGVDLNGRRGWLAMEFVQGWNLEDVLEQLERTKGPPAAPEIARLGGPRSHGTTADHWLSVFLAIAQGLAHLHQQGLVHRDIKPSNVMIREDGSPILIDLGLSRDLLRPVTLTHSLAQLGTPGFMAPEQFVANEERVGPWTDIYAFGALLHLVFLGRPRHDAVVPSKALGSYQRPLLLSPDDRRQLPNGLDAILYRCLELSPARRFQDASILSAELERIATGTGPLTPAPARATLFLRSRRNFIGTAVGGLVVLAGGIATATWRLARPTGYSLSVQAFNSGNPFYLDERHMGATPRTQIEVTPGRHVIRTSAEPFPQEPLEIPIEITPDRHHHSVILRTISYNADTALPISHSFTDRDDAALLNVVAPPGAEVVMNGKVIPPAENGGQRRWMRVPPGALSLTARDRVNHTEEHQDVELSPRESQEIKLLGWNHEDDANTPSPEAGNWVRTIGSVIMPLPSDVQFELDDGVVPFLASDQNKPRSDHHIARHTCFTGMRERERQSVTLKVAFPTAMSRAYVAIRIDDQVQIERTTRVEYRVDGVGWHCVIEEGELRDVITINRESGMTSLEVRVTQRPVQPAETYAQTSCFLGRVDPVLTPEFAHKGSKHAAQIIATPLH